MFYVNFLHFILKVVLDLLSVKILGLIKKSLLQDCLLSKGSMLFYEWGGSRKDFTNTKLLNTYLKLQFDDKILESLAGCAFEFPSL